MTTKTDYLYTYTCSECHNPYGSDAKDDNGKCILCISTKRKKRVRKVKVKVKHTTPAQKLERLRIKQMKRKLGWEE